MNRFIETFTGAAVLGIAVLFFVFAYKSAGIKTNNHSYHLSAKFSAADGIANGSDIRISGVKIGKVANLTLDEKSFFAVADLMINEEIKLPQDSSAKIVSDGLLGSKYISIIPGGDETNLANNEELKFTQSSINIESLISKFMFSSGDKKQE